jgi:SAM-dependent methyltransferase
VKIKGIKLNVGASPIWDKKGWMILDHKASKKTEKYIKGDASKIGLNDGACSLLFCSHVIEHMPHSKIQKVMIEFNRVLRLGGIIRILTPDLRRLAKAYVENNEEYFEKLLDEDENIRRDLGFGGMFMNCVVSPGQDTILLDRSMTEFIGGYAHIYAYDFDMLEILLSQAGFKMIKQMEFCKSSIAELEEPLHVEGFEREWQNLNKKFYADNGLIHKYQDGKYNINFSLTGFDRDPYSSLIVEAVKKENVAMDDVVDINGDDALNYNRYGYSLLCDEEVKRRMELLNIKRKF